jgi:2-polyprenyl-3-methyl-5-hydroxy-6-metoxy-1,4-benzoquinol methylase
MKRAIKIMNEMQQGESTPHSRYLAWADAVVGLRGKRVLEIGGCTPVKYLASIKPANWTCFNLDRKAVSEFQEQVRKEGLHTMTAFFQDAATISANESFDVAYSINAFEHIANLPKVLDAIYASLSYCGYLFSVFGPIWSSAVGHHLSVPSESGPISFNDGVIAPWEHLTSTRDELRQRLLK